MNSRIRPKRPFASLVSMPESSRPTSLRKLLVRYKVLACGSGAINCLAAAVFAPSFWLTAGAPV
jgi:hypothetical protein